MLWPWLFVAVRLWAILRAQAIPREAVGAPVIWEGAALVLAGCLAFGLTATSAETLWVASALDSRLALALLFEFALGSVLGQWASLLGHALLGAAGVSAQVLSTARGTTAGRGLVMLLVALTAASTIAMGIHRPLLAAMAESVELWPPGQPARWLSFEAMGLERVVWAARELVVLALALASPVLLCAVLTDGVLRLVGRGPASVAGVVDALRPWASTALALAALAAAWHAYPEAWTRALGLAFEP